MAVDAPDSLDSDKRPEVVGDAAVVVAALPAEAAVPAAVEWVAATPAGDATR